MSRVAITGVGAITSVGAGAAATAAALRAGVARPSPLRLQSFDLDELGAADVVGHPITGVTDGFEGPGLLAVLAGHALRDLLSTATLDRAPPDVWSETGLFLAVSPYRGEDESFVTELIQEHLAARIVAALGAPIPAEHCRVYVQGHAAALAAAADAAAAIGARQLARVLVVAVDSLLRTADLEWLMAEDRLKTTESPTGIAPGEAGAAILFEADGEARRRGARIEASLERIAVDVERGSRAAGEPSTGRGLADVVRRCLAEGARPGSLYLDLNGEATRAAEWGLALHHLVRTNPDLPPPATVASSIGDTGAASGGVALVAAVRALVRGYAGGDDCLVCSSDDSGTVAAALVHAA